VTPEPLAALTTIYPLSSGSDARRVVPCFDQFDAEAMAGVAYVILRERDWQRIRAVLDQYGKEGSP
jgi:hypothetical protein